MMENIHSETYSLLIDTYIKDTKEKDYLLNAIENLECVKKKADWALRWIEEATFRRKILLHLLPSKVFSSLDHSVQFSGWRKEDLCLDLSFSNELISRDEGMHCDLHVCYTMIIFKTNSAKDTIKTIICDAVEIEKEFVSDAIPVRLIGMNADMMCQYIEFVADRLIGFIR